MFDIDFTFCDDGETLKRTSRAGDEDTYNVRRLTGVCSALIPRIRLFITSWSAESQKAIAKGWKHECSRLLRAVPGQQVY